MRAAPLTTIKGGINRLRTKGGARADILYDLLNGYVTEGKTVKVRPGTRRAAELNPLTRGLIAFDGSRHTFCHVQVSVPDGYTLNILSHPDAGVGYEVVLEKIHFVAPFMGALYVVAEFVDGSIYHYWLQATTTWEATKAYTHGALVNPTVPNGLAYRASRLGDPYPSWTPNVPRFDGTGAYDVSIVEPTVYNDFYYTCVSAVGSNPVSGSTEPDWPTEDGAQVVEETTPAAESAAPPVPPSNVIPEATQERYGSVVRNPRLANTRVER